MAEPEFVIVNNGVDKLLIRDASSLSEPLISIMGAGFDPTDELYSVALNIAEGDATPTPDNVTHEFVALSHPGLSGAAHDTQVIGVTTFSAVTGNRPDPPSVQVSP